MTNKIFSGVDGWQGLSGSYWVSESSISNIPGVLVHDPLTAYCLGPADLNSGSLSYTTSSLNYAWRARYIIDESDIYSDQMYLERQLTGSAGWVTYGAGSEYEADITALKTDPGLFLGNSGRTMHPISIDCAISKQGYCYIVMECPTTSSLTDNEIFFYTTGPILSGSVTPTTGSGVADPFDPVVPFTSISKKFVRIGYGKMPKIVFKE